MLLSIDMFISDLDVVMILLIMVFCLVELNFEKVWDFVDNMDINLELKQQFCILVIVNWVN